ncbi:MAG: 4a-hydroxytetrahydrobiopterin dehydratase [Aquincola sp.]|nr:4a-hydroxytetrahydrobiopterin dehydratase [Aquincola sp.]MDH5331758.1 4a-hydroxytetrahydrobiopterin dehydratase [Aquincola sp.]
MSTPLASLRCEPLGGDAAMSTAEVEAHLARVPGWALVEGSIEKSFRFADYHRTMAFVNAVAWIAHRDDHHPDVTFSYNRARVRFNTHSVGGISLNDFICAAKVDALTA